MIEAEQIKAENEKKRMELIHAYKRFSKTDDGKVICEDLSKFCGYDNTCFNEQNPNSLRTMFDLGKRRVFLRVNGMINKKLENEE